MLLDSSMKLQIRCLRQAQNLYLYKVNYDEYKKVDDTVKAFDYKLFKVIKKKKKTEKRSF